MELPSKIAFAANPVFIVGVALALLAAGFIITADRDPIKKAPVAALISVVAVLGMSSAREALRMAYVGNFNYSIYDYPVRVDWGSTLLFLLTFVMDLL